MSLTELPLSGLTPGRLWQEFGPELRAEAARALYEHAAKEPALRVAADRAIARVLKFREAAVRKLPPERQVVYLARNARPDDQLASGLLQALHLEARRPLLAAFLDALGVAHDRGVIADDATLAPALAKLGAAVEAVSARFPAAEVDVYLLALLAMDPETWAPLLPILEARRGAAAS